MARRHRRRSARRRSMSGQTEQWEQWVGSHSRPVQRTKRHVKSRPATGAPGSPTPTNRWHQGHRRDAEQRPPSPATRATTTTARTDSADPRGRRRDPQTRSPRVRVAVWLRLPQRSLPRRPPVLTTPANSGSACGACRFSPRIASHNCRDPRFSMLSHAAGGRICLTNCFISYNVRDVAAL